MLNRQFIIILYEQTVKKSFTTFSLKFSKYETQVENNKNDKNESFVRFVLFVKTLDLWKNVMFLLMNSFIGVIVMINSLLNNIIQMSIA